MAPISTAVPQGPSVGPFQCVTYKKNVRKLFCLRSFKNTFSTRLDPTARRGRMSTMTPRFPPAQIAWLPLLQRASSRLDSQIQISDCDLDLLFGTYNASWWAILMTKSPKHS